MLHEYLALFCISRVNELCKQVHIDDGMFLYSEYCFFLTFLSSFAKIAREQRNGLLIKRKYFVTTHHH